MYNTLILLKTRKVFVYEIVTSVYNLCLLTLPERCSERITVAESTRSRAESAGHESITHPRTPEDKTRKIMQ